MATDNKIQIIISAVNKATAPLKKVSKSLSDFAEKNEKTFRKMRNVGAVAFGALSTAMLKFADDGSKLKEVEDAYGRLTKNIGVDADKLLKSLKESSKGAIDNKNLILSANKAMSLGVAQHTDEFTTLMDIARVKAKNMGLTTQQAFDDIVTGLGRGSPMILDNLGITVKLGEAQEEYAKALGKTVKELTDAEKKQALINKVVREGKEELKAMGDVEITLAEKRQKFNATLKNMKDTLGKALLPVMENILEKLSPIIEYISERIEKNPELTKNIALVTVAIAGLVSVLGAVGLAIGPITAAIGVLSGPIGIVIAAVTALGVARATNFGGIQEKTKAVWEYVKPILSEARENISTFFSDLWTTISEIFEELKPILIPIWELFKNAIVESLKIAWEYVKMFAGILGDVFKGITLIFKEIIQFVKHIFRGERKEAFQSAGNIGQILLDTLTNIFNRMYTALTNIVGNIGGSIKNIFTSIFNSIKDVAFSAVNFVIDKINAVIDAVNSVGEHIGVTIPKVKRLGEEARKVRQKREGPKIGSRPIGGNVIAGETYSVGEMGRELFVPNVSGKIVPNNQLNNQVPTVNINFSGGVHIKDEQDMNTFAERVREVMIQTYTNLSLGTY